MLVMIAAAVTHLGYNKLSSQSLLYFLNSYGCRIGNYEEFNSNIINYSSNIQFLINNHTKQQFTRYTDINKIIKFLENENKINLITITDQKEINSIAKKFVQLNVSITKGKKVIAQKHKETIKIIKSSAVSNYSKYISSIQPQTPEPQITNYINKPLIFFPPQPIVT